MDYLLINFIITMASFVENRNRICYQATLESMKNTRGGLAKNVWASALKCAKNNLFIPISHPQSLWSCNFRYIVISRLRCLTFK